MMYACIGTLGCLFTGCCVSSSITQGLPGLAGPKGERGDAGLEGIKGAPGPAGQKGQKGVAVSICWPMCRHVY